MNFKNFSVSVMLLVLVLSKNTQSSRLPLSNRHTSENQISSTFADLLQSLIRVNEERVNALNKFFKLNDFQAAQKMLRDGERSEEPLVLFVINDDVPEMLRQIPLDRKHYSDSDSGDSGSSSDSDGLTMERKDGLKDLTLRIHRIKDESGSDSSHEVVSSERKHPYNKSDTILTSGSDSSEEEERGKKPKPSGRLLGNCIAAATSRVRCTSACKAAYRNACYYSDRCSHSLYRRIRKECKYECRSRFY